MMTRVKEGEHEI